MVQDRLIEVGRSAIVGGMTTDHDGTRTEPTDAELAQRAADARSAERRSGAPFSVQCEIDPVPPIKVGTVAGGRFGAGRLAPGLGSSSGPPLGSKKAISWPGFFGSRGTGPSINSEGESCR